MTHPASINCHTCGTNVWSGGTVTDGQVVGVPAAPQTALTEFADKSCPRGGGLGCPNSTAARTAAADAAPATRKEMRQLQDRIAALERRPTT